MQSRRADHLYHVVDCASATVTPTTYKIKAAQPASTATFTQVPVGLRSVLAERP